MITTNLSTLKIHKLTQAQYDREVANGTIDENALYLTPDEEIDLSLYMTKNNPTGTGSFSMNRATDSAIGSYSVAIGYDTTASALASYAEGFETSALSQNAHAEGQGTEASGLYGSHAEGLATISSGGYGSHAEGDTTVASGVSSHAEGKFGIARGKASHIEGSNTEVATDSTTTPTKTTDTSAGYCGHAEGYGTVSYGTASHAEGNGTIASGSYSHSEGVATTASGKGAHAEGEDTTASAQASHAEGYNTTASSIASHAEGMNTTASGMFSHAAGHSTVALDNQYVIGHHNKSGTAGSDSGTTGDAFIIGKGTSSSKSNALRLTYAGKLYVATSGVSTGADYAEFFEWKDGNPNNEDRRGYFVTLDGENIKIAEPNDYILGIISGMPAIIGNGDEEWRGRYILDEFGAFITEEFEYEIEVFDEETGETNTVTKVGTKYQENPDYNPTLPYIQREDRPEWDTVGMMGVLAVRDDGTCQVNGYCKVAEGGIATASESGYRIIKRINENIVKVVFK